MRIRHKAMDLLSRREHSVDELFQKLLVRDYSADEISQTLEELINDNLLSNERFCEDFVRAKIAKGYGPVKIRQELQQKGISSAMISDYLNQSDEVWLDHLSQVKIKKFGQEAPQDLKQKAKQMRFLQYRGFSIQHINQIINHDDF
jgi:regulatory protein